MIQFDETIYAAFDDQFAQEVSRAENRIAQIDQTKSNEPSETSPLTESKPTARMSHGQNVIWKTILLKVIATVVPLIMVSMDIICLCMVRSSLVRTANVRVESVLWEPGPYTLHSIDNISLVP